MKLKIIIICVLAVILAAVIIYKPGGDPQKAQEYLAEGKNHYIQGDADAAIKAYKRGVKADPKSSEAYNLLGMAYRGKYFSAKERDESYLKKAVESFEKSIAADQRNWYPYLNLGTTYYYSGKRKASLPYLRKAIELNPHHMEAKQILEMVEEVEKEK